MFTMTDFPHKTFVHVLSWLSKFPFFASHDRPDHPPIAANTITPSRSGTSVSHKGGSHLLSIISKNTPVSILLKYRKPIIHSCPEKVRNVMHGLISNNSSGVSLDVKTNNSSASNFSLSITLNPKRNPGIEIACSRIYHRDESEPHLKPN